MKSLFVLFEILVLSLIELFDILSLNWLIYNFFSYAFGYLVIVIYKILEVQ